MVRSLRWLIPGGYACLVAGFAIGSLLPPGSDELGLANAMSALALGMVGATVLFLVGIVRGVQAIVRQRDRVRWFDYLLLALGVAPFALIGIAPLLPLR